MTIQVEFRRVEIKPAVPAASSMKFVTVHFTVQLDHGVASNGGRSLDISFETNADHGLDQAVADATIELQRFGEALAEAAKNKKFSAAVPP
jgi:hypothetical protein